MEITPTSSDTSKQAANLQHEILRNMTLTQRAELTFQLSDNLRSTVISGIKHRHPEYTNAQTIKAYLSLTVDKETLEKAMPGIEATP